MIQEGSSKLASVPSGGGAAPAAAGGAAGAAGGEAAPAEEEKKEEEKEESDEDVRKRLSMSLMFRWDSDCSIRAQESSIYVLCDATVQRVGSSHSHNAFASYPDSYHVTTQI